MKTRNHPRTPLQKKRRTALFVGVALVLALAFVFVLPSLQALFPKENGPLPLRTFSFETLDETQPDTLVDITVAQGSEDPFTLVYQHEQLFLQKDGSLVLIDELLAQKILKAATLIAVEDVVADDLAEIRKHLPEMGLEPPKISVTVRYQDGREDLLQLGNNVPETTYYYYRWSGSQKVYMCDEGVYEAFSYTAAMLLPVNQPILQKSLIDQVVIRARGQNSMELQLSTDSAGMTSGTLLSPYRYPLDATAIGDLVTAITNFRLGTFQEEVTPETLTTYGFDDPLTVIDIHQQAGVYGALDENGILTSHEADEQTLRIVLGRKEGDYFYTCEYDGKCYYVSAFLASALLAVTPDSLITRHPADLGGATLAQIQVQLGGRMLDIRRQQTERVLPNNQLATDEAGNTLYDVSATLNGEPIPAEAFDGLVNRLKIMQVAGDVDSHFSPGAATPRWQLTLTTTGGTVRTISAYPMDAFFDAIAVDGIVEHTLQAESLEAALADFLP